MRIISSLASILSTLAACALAPANGVSVLSIGWVCVALIVAPSKGRMPSPEERHSATVNSGNCAELDDFMPLRWIRTQLKSQDIEQIVGDLFTLLSAAGMVTPKEELDGGIKGYQVSASPIRFRAGDGTSAYHDPLRIPRPPVGGLKTNPFFVDFYRGGPELLQGLEAREHTAQVASDKREDREDAFREGRLPVLYCSPTMELGVDIKELDVVGLRNVPPSPANYAQRSGRAGRSGQAALVFTYCSAGSPHDQFFFRAPERMVAGVVTAPRLDLANEDLLRSHVHAIWLSASGLDFEAIAA